MSDEIDKIYEKYNREINIIFITVISIFLAPIAGFLLYILLR
jgi:hypothetical protein